MKQSPNGIALTVTLALALLPASAIAGEAQYATISGTLVGIAEDNDGNYTRVFLQDEDLRRILVANNDKGKQLSNRAGSAGIVHGRLVELDGPELGFTLEIYVESWKPLPTRKPKLDADVAD